MSRFDLGIISLDFLKASRYFFHARSNREGSLIQKHRHSAWPFKLFATLLALAVFGCGARNDPAAVADKFCFRYFVELNQPGALELASGLAADKLRKEIELLKGAARTFEGGEREFHQLKPFIDYKMTDRATQDEDHVLFIYLVTIEARQGSDKMRREIVLNLLRKHGRWTVNNYDFEH